jgi:hypothetical protein
MKTLLVLIAVSGFASGVQGQIADFTPPTPLLGALMHNDTIEAKRLLDEGADPNQGSFGGFPPLILAVVRQNLELVRMMAAKGANVNCRDRSGSTALMWAAFNESGDPSVVEELLKSGVDPFAANKAGETAITWALKRGETSAVAALRKAGLRETDAIRTSVEKALLLLQRSGAQFTRISGCYSCHHQSLPQMAHGIARTRGLTTDEPAARQQVDSTIALLKTVAGEAVTNRDRVPNPPISLSYTLVGLAAEGYQRDETTDMMAQVIAAWQSGDGAFYPLPPIRPPLESSEFAATALSLRALQLYGRNPEELVARARHWLTGAWPRTNEDCAMQLLGLVWSKAPGDAVRKAMLGLLAGQRPDGGWAQLAGLETDAYATGQALVALHEAGIATGSPENRRGVGFLMRTQFPDGSWLVRSRTFPVQRIKDSGFPHGRDQWISAAGTSWAAMALALTLPLQRSGLDGRRPPSFLTKRFSNPADGLRRDAQIGSQHPLGNARRNGRVGLEELQIAFPSRCAQGTNNAPISCGRSPLKSEAVCGGVSGNPLDKLFVRRRIYEKKIRILDGVDEELGGRSRRQTDTIDHPPGFRGEGDDVLLASRVDRILPHAARGDETRVPGNFPSSLKEFPAAQGDWDELRPNEGQLLTGERCPGFEVGLQDVET